MIVNRLTFVWVLFVLEYGYGAFLVRKPRNEDTIFDKTGTSFGYVTISDMSIVSTVYARFADVSVICKHRDKQWNA